MANPDAKALQAAAATMRTQAEEARKAFVPAEGQRDKDVLAAQENAYVQKHAAEQAVKDQQTIVDHYTHLKADVQKQLDDDKPKIAEAEKKGDTAALEELHEHQARLQTQIAGFQERQDAAQQALDQGKVTVAERTRDMDEVNRRYGSTLTTDNTAEKQIDALEDKAKLLNEAGLKLDLARTIDNPVERADMELDAEKLLKQANAIQVDTKQITAVTGQELQIPDVSALPPASDVADATGAATTDGDAASSGDGAVATGDGASAADDGQGALEDPFASSSGSSSDASTDSTADASAATTTADAAVAADGASSTAPAMATAPADDVLGASPTDTGGDVAVAAPPALDDAGGVAASTAPDLDAPALDAQPDAASFSTDADVAVADPGSDFSAPANDDATPAADDGDLDA